MRSPEHTDYSLTVEADGTLEIQPDAPVVQLERRIDVQELHRALGEYLAETKCARCDGTGTIDDLIDRQAPCPDCRTDSALLTEQPQPSAAQSAPAGEREAVAYEHWKVDMEPYGFSGLDAFQAGAAWQRTQSAPVVPDDAMVAVASAAYEREALAGATHEQAWHAALSEAFAAAPAQPAAQDQVDQQEGLHVWRATSRLGYTCHFGEASAARAWAGENGTIERVDLTPVHDLQVVERQDQSEVQRLREALEGVVKRCSKEHGGSGYVGQDGQYLKVIDAALSAQQSEPERVSVPVELLERAVGNGLGSSIKAIGELRVLLEGWKV